MSFAPDTLEALDARLLGTFLTPSDPGWDKARAAWNLAVDQRPAAVLLAVDVADISTVVRQAAAEGLRVMGQTTGHLAAAVGDLSDTVLIRTTRMQDIKIDHLAQTVRVEAGATWGAVNTALEGTGLVGLAGSSHDVGVVGYTIGGGYGWLARSRGLAASSVVAAELVLADGEIVRATADEHRELFWAIRGGGGDFGIVTALEFRVYPITEVYAGMLLYPVEQAREVLSAYASWSSDLDERVTSCVRILRFPPMPELPEFVRGRSFVGVDGAVDADDATAEALLAPLRALAPEIDTFGRMPATGLTAIHMDPPTPVPAAGDGLALRELSTGTIEALLDSSAGASDSPLLFVDIRQLGGALGRPAEAGGAVDSLAGEYLLYAGGFAPSPEAAEAVRQAVLSVQSALAPWAAERDYGNFREVEVPAESIWAAGTLTRLRAVKSSVDPDGVIRSAHPLSSGAAR